MVGIASESEGGGEGGGGEEREEERKEEGEGWRGIGSLVVVPFLRLHVNIN